MAGIEVEGLSELQAACAREETEVPRDVLDSLEESAGYVRDTYRQIAPKASGRMASSAQVSTDAQGATVQVTARRSSPKYPNFPYPVVIEASKRPLSRAVQFNEERINQRNEQVLDKAVDRWGGS